MMADPVPPTSSPPEGALLVHSPVLDLLEEAFADPSVTTAINDFCTAHASKFNLAPSDEQPLEYHGLYLQYTEMLESRVEAFMAANDVTLDQILDAARHAPAGVHTFVEYLLASTEYEAFLQLMYDFASMEQWVDVDGGAADGPLEP